MIGSIKDCIESMEKGITNFTKDGKCSRCGQCCSALLPLSMAELRTIKKYVERKNIKPSRHTVLMNNSFDMICPFLDNSGNCTKCKIYEVRPKICRAFRCNVPPSKVEENKELFWQTRSAYYMWSIFDDEL